MLSIIASGFMRSQHGHMLDWATKLKSSKAELVVWMDPRRVRWYTQALDNRGGAPVPI